MSDLSRADYLYLRELLKTRAGHDLGEGKEYLVESRLAILAETRADVAREGATRLIDRLRRSSDRGLEEAVVEAMMTGETSFFRNPSVFQCLERSVLPLLIAARSSSRRLRFWSAGCSTGQEPYSLAILLDDRFPELRGWDVEILATDISLSAIRQARAGVYGPAEIRRGLSDELIRANFEPVQGRWRILPRLQRLIRFDRLNLADSLPFDHEFDIIMVRNVLIYFDVALKPRIFRALRGAIRDDGFLFLGDSETVLGVSDAFTCADHAMACYRPF